MRAPPILLFLLFVGCGLLDNGSHHDPLADTYWQLEAVTNTQTEPDDYEIYRLHFSAYQNTVDRSGECRGFGGVYHYPRPGWIEMNEWVTTYQTCPPRSPFEQEWQSLFRIHAKYELTDSTLTLKVGGNSGKELHFRRIKTETDLLLTDVEITQRSTSGASGASTLTSQRKQPQP